MEIREINKQELQKELGNAILKSKEISLSSESSFNSYLGDVVDNFTKKLSDQKSEEKATNNKYSNSYINEFKTSVDKLKSAYNKNNSSKTIEDKAYAKEDTKKAVKNLSDKLDKVSKELKSDKKVSKEDLKKLKDSIKDIPKEVSSREDISEKITDIEKTIENIENTNSDITINIDNSKDIADALKGIQDGNLTNEQVVSALQNLVQLLQSTPIEDLTEMLGNEVEGINASDIMNFINGLDTTLQELTTNSNLDVKQIFMNLLNNNSDAIVKLMESNTSQGEEVKNLMNLLQEAGVVTGKELNEDIMSTMQSVIQNEEVNTRFTQTNINNTQNNINYAQINVDNTQVVQETQGNTSDASSQNLSQSSEGTKEDLILQSIIDGKAVNATDRFTMVSSNYSVSSNNIVTAKELINEATMARDLVQNIKFMSAEGIDKLMVKINPRELGELVISLSKDANGMKADIEVTNKETYRMLLQNSDEIKKYLGEQNIKIDEVNISLAKDTTEHKTDSSLEQFFGENRNRHNDKKEVTAIDGTQSDDIEDDDEYSLLGDLNILV